MTHHPFLNPHSSKIILDQKSIHLSPFIMVRAGAIATALAVAGNCAVYITMTRGLHLTPQAELFGAMRTLRLVPLIGATCVIGAVSTAALFALNTLTQEPLRLFRMFALVVFVLSCVGLLVIPLTPLLRLIGLCSLTLTAAAIVTPLTYYTNI